MTKAHEAARTKCHSLFRTFHTPFKCCMGKQGERNTAEHFQVCQCRSSFTPNASGGRRLPQDSTKTFSRVLREFGNDELPDCPEFVYNVTKSET